MSPQIQSFLASVGAVGIIVGAFLLVAHPQQVGLDFIAQNAEKTTATTTAPQNTPIANPTNTLASTTSLQTEKTARKSAVKAAAPPQIKKNATQSAPENKQVQNPLAVSRIEHPYPFPPQPFDVTNAETRLALVNILCGARSGSFRPTSGSGVIIDPRGVILTNAHVAQYVLLASDPKVDLSCIIRGGSPARPLWNVEVLYIPPAWVKEHANEITLSRSMSTGEHDYALLRIKGTIDGSPMPVGFPYLLPDAREAIGFIDDPVLVASYPAEFIGGITSQFSLFSASSITNIKDLLTFTEKTIDVISLGGIIEAQSGSSGGAVTNAWGRLIGIISTTSEGTTTAQRDLRAITLSYINRDLSLQSGFDLPTILAGDVGAQTAAFNTNDAPALLKLLIDRIEGRTN